MAKQRSDSPNVCQIVRSFVDFLNSIEVTSDGDTESVQVARYCLRKAFGLDSSSTDEGVPQGLLLDLFSSWEGKQLHKLTSGSEADLNSIVSAEDSHVSATVQVEDKSKQERLYDAILAKSSVEAAQAAQPFNEELAECLDQIGSSDKIADSSESKGNQAKQSKQYAELPELDTKADSFCEDREVACMKNLEAIKDCLKAIDIDPKNSEAYSQLGLSFSALGKYHEALTEGFLRALKLDPDNQTVQENIEMTRSKLNYEHENKILALCNSSQVGSFSNGSNSVNPECQQRTDSADEIRDLAEAFLDLSCESNSDSRGSGQVDSDNVLVANVTDVNTTQVLAELGGPHGAVSQGLCLPFLSHLNLGGNYVLRESALTFSDWSAQVPNLKSM